MIKRASECKTDLIPQMRGGKLTTTVAHFMTEEESGGVGKNFSINTLVPGASIGYHQHVGNFEVYRILTGEAVVEDNDKKEHTLGPGDVMLCRDGESHSIENRGSEDVSFIAVILYSK